MWQGLGLDMQIWDQQHANSIYSKDNDFSKGVTTIREEDGEEGRNKRQIRQKKTEWPDSETR